MILAVTSDVPGVTADEIIFSLQNVKCSKVSKEDGIVTEELYTELTTIASMYMKTHIPESFSLFEFSKF